MDGQVSEEGGEGGDRERDTQKKERERYIERGREGERDLTIITQYIKSESV